MKILYVAFKYDYGDPTRGLGFEHYNFYESLVGMGHDILYFDVGSLRQKHRKEGMSRRLLDVALAEKPDLLFAVLQNDDLDAASIRQISSHSGTITFNWFCDDHWRFDSFSSHWVGEFNWVATTADSAIPKYRALGYQNVIKSQWACNHFRYHPLNIEPEYKVTFVGMPHGNRRYVVERLRRANIDIRVWGKGWELGRIDQEAMIRVFNQSVINLNLSNASPPPTLRSRGIDAAIRLVERAPLTPGRRELLARRLALVRQQIGGGDAAIDQIKGRNFEIPGCAGFLLTGQAENLEAYYVPGKEVACFRGVDELLDKVQHYLRNPNEREAIAQAGYVRTMQEHTYVHRFVDVFTRVGLGSPSAAAILANPPHPGSTEDVA